LYLQDKAMLDPQDEGSAMLRNIDKYLAADMAEHP
jgi:hypothetical protein